MPDDDRYSLTDLADLAGVTPRTVRYYLAQGLLPAVGQRGPRTTYDQGHLARLRLIRRLQGEHLPLAEIRRRIEALGEDEIRELAGSTVTTPPSGSALEYLRTVLGDPARGASATSSLLRRIAVPPAAVADQAVEPAAPAGAAPHSVSAEPTPPLERSQWERVALAPDIELHIRRPLSRAQNKQVDRLVTIARELLEEDRP
jgi:DNA-binding transcriptional MerR regulator